MLPVTEANISIVTITCIIAYAVFNGALQCTLIFSVKHCDVGILLFNGFVMFLWKFQVLMAI